MNDLSIALVDKLLKKDFVRSMGVLVLGGLLAQVINFISLPFLSRLYAPEAFGELGTYMGVVAFLVVISSLRYDLALNIPKKGYEVEYLFIISHLINIAFFLGACLAVFIWWSQKEVFGGFQMIWAMLPLSVLFLGASKIFDSWNTREKRFLNISLAQINQIVFVVGFQFVIYYYADISNGLVVGAVCGAVMAVLTQIFLYWRAGYNPFARRLSISRTRSIAVKYSGFPKYSAPQAAVSSLGHYLPIFMLSYFYGAKVAGFYLIADKVVRVPVYIFTIAFRRYFIQKISTLTEESLVGSYLRKSSLYILMLVVPGTVVFFFVAGKLFGVVFGEQWIESGKYAAWLSLWGAAMLLVGPANCVLTLKKHMRAQLVLDVVQTTMRAGVILLSVRYGSAEMAVGLSSVTGLLLNAVVIVFAFRITRS